MSVTGWRECAMSVVASMAGSICGSCGSTEQDRRDAGLHECGSAHRARLGVRREDESVERRKPELPGRGADEDDLGVGRRVDGRQLCVRRLEQDPAVRRRKDGAEGRIAASRRDPCLGHRAADEVPPGREVHGRMVGRADVRGAFRSAGRECASAQRSDVGYSASARSNRCQ